MAVFYADEDFLGPVVTELRALGHDVFTVQQDGLSGYGVPDPDVLARAIALGRCVLTKNRWTTIACTPPIPRTSASSPSATTRLARPSPPAFTQRCLR